MRLKDKARGFIALQVMLLFAFSVATAVAEPGEVELTGTFLIGIYEYADHNDKGPHFVYELEDSVTHRFMKLEFENGLPQGLKSGQRVMAKGRFLKGREDGSESRVFEVGSESRVFEVTTLTEEEVTTLTEESEGVTEEGRTPATVLVLHITTNDSQTTKSPAQLSDDVFGTNGDPVNLVSQYAAISYDQKNYVPAEGTHIVDGVLQVTLDQNSNGEDNVDVRNAAITAANDLLGYSIGSEFDHVMIANPPGTDGGWIAYAHVHGWMSVYNDGWASSLSAQMHEVGHNLGLAHAGESGAAYGDQSGMMGFSYFTDDGPEMGFNATKTWQFGWYPDANETITMDQDWSGPWSGQLVGFVDYENVSPGQNVALKVDTPDADDTNIYISYNRQTGMNSGTVEAGDQVLVHSKAGEGYSQSWLVAKLNPGASYIAIFPGMESESVVTFVGTETSNGVQYANVKIRMALPLFSDGFE